MHTTHPNVDRLTVEVARLARRAPEQIDTEADLVAELGLDSLDLLTLLAWAEREYSTRFPDERLGELTSVGAIARALGRGTTPEPGRRP